MSRKYKTIATPGLNLIKHFEGLRLTTYKDIVGIATIGYGHVEHPLPPGGKRTISEQQADQILKEDLQRFERAVNSMLTVEVTQNQFDALISFSFNLGSQSLKNSTLLRKLNAGNAKEAANEFMRWNRAGGKEVSGLTRRREAERQLFIS
ncbi:lysozyme [Enterobacteriaceae bacterium H16N7]|nr:lysozyme [Dryocola clanedunensis]